MYVSVSNGQYRLQGYHDITGKSEKSDEYDRMATKQLAEQSIVRPESSAKMGHVAE